MVDNKGFTGHETLEQLDLVYVNGRVYDPLVARFLSADSFIQDPYNRQNYSRYIRFGNPNGGKQVYSWDNARRDRSLGAAPHGYRILSAPLRARFVASQPVLSHRFLLTTIHLTLAPPPTTQERTMIASDSLYTRASTSPLLPPEVVVQTSWFGRARNFSIFSLAWYRYRSTAFLIGTLLVALLLTALAAVPAQPVDLDWGDVLQWPPFTACLSPC